MYSHQSDTVQINAPEYDPDIDRDNQPNTDEKHTTVSIQGTLETIPESSVSEDDNSIAPENNTDPQNQQETNWPDALAIQISGVPGQQQISHRRLHTTDDKFSPLQKISKYLS